MNPSQVLTELHKERRDLAKKFNAITLALIGLGEEPENLSIFDPHNQDNMVYTHSLPELPTTLPRQKQQELKSAVPPMFRPRPQTSYPPETNLHEYSNWQDKILFALKEIGNGFVPDIAQVIKKYEPGSSIDSIKNSVTFRASLMYRSNLIKAEVVKNKNKYSLK